MEAREQALRVAVAGRITSARRAALRRRAEAAGDSRGAPPGPRR
jgi:hypothetical protein